MRARMIVIAMLVIAVVPTFVTTSCVAIVRAAVVELSRLVGVQGG